LGVLVYIALAISLGLIILGLSWKVSPRRLDLEKATAYECGFDPFGEARSPFDVGFYLVAILFLVFDIEVAYLFPWLLEVWLLDGQVGQLCCSSCLSWSLVLSTNGKKELWIGTQKSIKNHGSFQYESSLFCDSCTTSTPSLPLG